MSPRLNDVLADPAVESSGSAEQSTATASSPTPISGALLQDLLSSYRFLGSDLGKQVVTVDAEGPCPGRYEIRLATTPDELLEAFALRYESYQHHGYLNPAYSYPLGLEYDEHDRNAALFTVRNTETGALHGTARLAYDTDGALPMDEFYSLDACRERIGHDRGVVLAEFSRLISHPTGQKQTNRALVRTVFQFACDNGVDYIFGAGRVDIRHYYDKWGFREVDPGSVIDVDGPDGKLLLKMQLYAHYMSVEEIVWECI